MTVRVNLLCMAGVLLGVVSLFLPWITSSTAFGVESEDMVIQDIIMRSAYFEWPLILPASLFVLGVFLALLTPTSGFIQLVGVLGIVAAVPSEYRYVHGDQSYSIGFFLGLFSALIVIASFFVPRGAGYGDVKGETKGGVNWPSHLLTICPLRPSARLRINVFCLFGGILGFAAMALPWLLLTETTIAGAVNTVEFNVYYHLDSDEEVLALTAFLVGTILALFTPLGGVPQLIGALWFASDVSEDMVTYNFPWGTMSLDWGMGFYLALPSCAIVLISLFVPIGVGYSGTKKSTRRILLVWGEATPAYILTQTSREPGR